MSTGYLGRAALRREQCNMTAEKVRILEQEKTAVARQRLVKHISLATDMHTQ
jgi:hypothetical protein